MTDEPITVVGGLRQLVVEYAAAGDNAASVVAERVMRIEEVEKYPGLQRPYVTLDGPISDVPILKGDARALGWRADVDVGLWQTLGAEDDRLLDALIAAIDGRRAPIGLRWSVIGRQRVPDDEADVVHDVITCSVALLR